MPYIEERVSKSGKKTFRALIRKKGHPTACATFHRKTDAVAWAKETEVAMQQGRYLKITAARKHTVADMIDRYLAKVERENPKRLPEVRRILHWWRTEVGYLVIGDLSSSIISDCVVKLSEATREFSDGRIWKRSPARVNRMTAALSHACSVAEKEWQWIDHNPVSRLKKLREPTGRVRFLDDDERMCLLNACRQSDAPALYPVVALAISTGMRRGEILSLQWQDVDFVNERIIIQKTKNGTRRAVPLTGHAKATLQEWGQIRRIDTDLVFPSPVQPKQAWQCRVSWDMAVKRAGIEDFRFHDLRHTAASYLAMNDATLVELAEILGHKTLQMVKRYAHLSQAHTLSVVASMNERIFANV